MSLLSFYSKIQLKIGKAEEKQRWFHGPDRAVEPKCETLQKGSTAALKGLWSQQFLKLQLLFWKIAKIIVRFFALLFNDSSENFLMFASEYKAKRLHSPEGTMEPAITFVCNNSFCQYKRFQKRVRFYSKTAFAGILICTIITSSILYFMMPNKPSSYAATFAWVQTDWSGGSDGGTYPNHASNQTGWTKYSSKDAEISASSAISLNADSYQITETSDTDFSSGTLSNASVSGTGDSAYVKLSQGLAASTASTSMISTGFYRHTCAVMSDNSVQCWGYNASGQLGDGTTTNSSIPVSVSGITSATAISAGYSHTCALLSDNTVKCWGNNGYGQLGNGTRTSSSIPVSVSGLTNAVAISSGGHHTCALLSDNTAKCWGNNNKGELGDGTTTDRTTPVSVSGITTATAISAGGAEGWAGYTCALLSDNTAKCWGDNKFGQLGDGTTTGSSIPVSVSGLTNITSIEAGGSGTGSAWSSGGHTCAILSDNTAKCWGCNSSGQLGDGTTTDSSIPVSVSGLTNISSISAGYYHTCAVLSDDTAKCWGRNTYGQLGDETATQRTTPVSVSGLTNISSISAGFSHTCALLSDGTAKCWGYNNQGQLGDGTITTKVTPVSVSGIANATAISAGVYYACALLSDGTAKCWGHNEYGKLGDGTTTQRNTPVSVSNISNAIAISAGFSHTCAVLSDGTAKCWGYNGYGRLGDGTTTQRTTPVSVSGIITATDIAVGESHTCAILSDGTAKCWGYNGYGRLGDGTETNSTVPVSVSGIANATAISAGRYHTCALLSDGAIKCWGYNVSGRLGDGTTTNSSIPVSVLGITNATAISAGYEHTCAVLSDGTAKCWGENYAGRLGDGTGTDRTTPVSVLNISNATAISAGYSHSCAVLSDGAAKCWGYNTSGQLGDGTTTSSSTPVSVLNISNATAISAGGRYHSCAVVANGASNCWGYNENGQLGDGIGNANKRIPTDVSGIGGYYTSGTFNSQIIDTTINTAFSNYSVDFTAPANTSLVLKARSSDLSDMTDAPFWNECVNLTGFSSDLSDSNCVTNTERYIQYYAELVTTDTSQTYQFNDITLDYLRYPAFASLISSAYDSSDSASVLADLTWTESGTSATELVKFQLRTAPDSSGSPGAWSDWLGPIGTGDYYTTSTGNIINSNHADGSGDQWLQYKAILYSEGSATPSLSDLNLTYVVNNPPLVSNVAVSQGADGVVAISYDLVDSDSSSFAVSALADIGITLNEELTSSDATAISVSDSSSLPNSGTIQIENEQISYTLKSENDLTGTITRGANNTKALPHSSAATVWIKGTAVSGDAGASQTAGTGKSINWTIKTDMDEIYSATAKIRVSANDGNAANQVGNGDSVTFTLDTKDPVSGAAPIAVDASISPADLTLSATDDTALEMKISLNADLAGASYETYNVSSTIELATDPDTVYVQFKDAKGNTSSIQSATTPETPTSAMTQDTSNTLTSEWRLFVAWGVVAEPTPGFASYEVYRSEDNITYAHLASVTDRATNFHADGTTVYDITYYYKIFTKDSDGSQSYYSTVTFGKADGTQGDGEGGGGGDEVAPVITHDYSTQITNITSTTATITFTTDELSDSYIGYSTDTGYGNEQGVPTMIAGGENHTVTLVGLNENTQYHYKIKSRDPSNNVGTSQDDINYVFTTATDTTAPVISFSSATDISSIADSSAVISWTTDEAATSRVDYGTDTSYGSNEANANYNVDHSITLSSLLPETTYYFKLTSVDNSISANSATDDNSEAGYTFTTLASSDSTPPTISAVGSGTPLYNTATITWVTDENANSLVDFGTSTSYGSTQGNSANLTTSHSVVLTGLASDTTYYYRAKSMDVSGNTAIDDNSEAGYTFITDSAPTPGDTTAPVISGVSDSSVTSTSATISWTTDENSDSTVGFSLDTSFDQEQGSTTATTSHSISLVNLAPETTYYYQVKSRDSGGNLGTDNNSDAGYSFTTLAGGDALAPVISNVTISDITANTAKVSWTTNENSNSLVDYSETSGVFTSTAGKYQDNTTAHSVTLTGLDPSTAYYLQARSADASGNESKDSSGGTGYTFTTTAGGDETPPEITDISAGTPTYSSVAITWTTNELSNSLVDFGTSTSYGTTQGNSADSVTSHSVTLTGLSPSTTYYYRVKSIDVSGNLISDDNSGNGHTFTTAAGADPGDTTAPVITFDSGAGITNVTSNSATIAWTTDESSDSIIGYSLDTSFNSEKGSATLTTSHSVTLTNLSSGTAYKFQIKSMDASGNLATENNSGAGYTFTTLAGGDSTAPIITNVASGTCTDTTATITWTTDENSSSLVDYGTVLGTYLSTGGNYKASVTAHSVTLTGLTAETIYYYRVRSIDANNNQALDAGGVSGYSFTTIAATESECPDCPSCGGGGGGSCPSVDTNPPTISNVKVSEITTNSAVVKWETNEKSYSLVEYGLDDSYGSTNGSATANVTNHTVALTKLDSNTTYHYRVLSADSSGNLAQSEDFTFKTVTLDELTLEEQKEQTQELNETTATEIQTKIEELLTQGIDEEEIRIIIARASEPPVISTEGPIVENVTNNSAKVIWITDRKSNSVIRFKAKEERVDPEKSPSLKQYGNFKELAVEHQVVLASLNSGTSYQYQVQSSDVLGNTSKSDWNEFSTEVTPSIYDVIISEITLNSAVISWKTNVVTSSKVEYGETISYTNSVEDKGLAKIAKHSIKLNNLKSGTLYHFRVRGISGEGNSLVSDDYTFTTFTLPQIETYQIEEIAERTIKLNWKTNVETDSTLKYTDLETNITKIQGEDGMSSVHNFTLKGLNPGTEYLLQIQGRDIYGNQAITSEFTAITLADNTVPEIKQVRTETAVSSGKSDVVQTIISWKTNEPATSQILWEEGISEDSIPKNATIEDENYTTNHIMVITTFKPASVYRFRIQGKDKAGNIAQSKDFTILIPEKKKSVIQIIISNFEDTFGWVKKIGL